MDLDEIMLDVEEHFEKSVDSLVGELRRIRTGRASAGMIDHVHVEAYGASVSIKQVAGISVPEPQQLLIKPYDKGTIRDIEKALIAADLGMSPQNDGELIRLNIPPLSGERRKELANQAKESGERCRVAMRNARRDGIKQIESSGKDEKWPEDTVKKAADDVTELLKQYEGKVDHLLKEKTEDILAV
jgi:ribosome recycling factor